MTSDFYHQELFDILSLTEKLHVPECIDGLHRPLTELDFLEYREKCERNLIIISNALKDKVEGNKNNEVVEEFKFNHGKTDVIINLVVLIGEHSALNIWSSNTSVEIAENILTSLLKLVECSSLEELLVKNNSFVLKNVLLTLRQKLLTSTWKCNPAAVLCYCWILSHVKSPFLDDHLDSTLPTALIITDDFETSNRIKGLQCINHILNNVTKGNLEMLGQNEVVLEALRPIFYHFEPEVLEPLIKCFLTLVKKMCMPSYQVYINLQRNKFDHIFGIILNNFNLEERYNCKMIYLKYLMEIISVFNLHTLRHSRKLFDTLARELNSEADDNMKCLVLEILDSTIKACWPCQKIKNQLRSILLELLKLIIDYSVTYQSHAVNNKLVIRIRTSFQLFKKLWKEEFDEIGLSIKNNDNFNENFKNLTDFTMM